MLKDIEQNKKHPKAHFIGLCGKGMSAVAVLLSERGWEISGSDAGVYDPIKSYLEKASLTCNTPHAPENIPTDVDLVVLGRHAKLTPEKNDEVRHASENFGDVLVSFPQVLGELTQETQQNIVIAGSYGKSTTTALLAHILQESSVHDPSYFIGALPYGFKRSSHDGESEIFILEGDEYPSSYDDQRSKFLHYNATSLLLTSLEHDHINVFPTLPEYHTPFIELIESLPTHGTLIACAEGPHVLEILEKHPSKARIATYGLNSGDYTAKNITYGLESSFDIYKNDGFIGNFAAQLLGEHNIQNCIGVIACVLEHEWLNVDELQKYIPNFQGLRRRLDRIDNPETSRFIIYEGYGSSYTKAKTAIEALQLHFPDKELHVLFEPHTFSWRNREYIDAYDTVFAGVDHIAIYPPPMHGKSTHDQLSHDEIVERVQKNHPQAVRVNNLEDIENYIEQNISDNAVLLVLTSGSFDDQMKKIISAGKR